MMHLTMNITPEVAFWQLKALHQPFWLDSGKGDTERSRYSLLGANPVATYWIDSGGRGHYCTYTIGGDISASETSDAPFELLRRILRERQQSFSLTLNTNEVDSNCGIAEALPFVSGGVGYLSYEARHLIERLPRQAVEDLPIPWGRFDFYNWCYVYDHHDGIGYLVSPYPHVDLMPWQVLLSQAIPPNPRSGPFIASEPVPDMTLLTYQGAIQSIKDYIASGDIYQMNMTQRFKAQALGNPIDLYYRLRQVNPAPFSAFLSYPEFTALCSSPERFVQVRGRTIETRPIKGTVRRHADPEADAKGREWLSQSVKDRSELLMIVDLERNDLSKVAAKGSVAVPELFVIETYPTVHHLVSTVTATLAEGKDLVDVLQAVFPGGSITGTPKIRAMEIIDSLEPTTRNLYTGTIGYLCDSGDMDLNIVIRTIVRQGDCYHYQVGGGIVWDSITDSEYEECFTKGKALVEALASSKDPADL